MLLPARIVAQTVKLRFPINETNEAAQKRRADACHRDSGGPTWNFGHSIEVSVRLSETGGRGTEYLYNSKKHSRRKESGLV
jgi:hypothetical protein